MDKNRRIREIMTTFTNDCVWHANSLVPDVDYHFRNFLVEQTIREHSFSGIPLKIDISWQVETGNFTYRTLPTNMLAILLTDLMIVLGVWLNPASIQFLPS